MFSQRNSTGNVSPTLSAITASSAYASEGESELGRATMRRVTTRLLPFLFVLYVVNWMDRENVGIAALQLNRDLRLSGTAYGLGAGIFFVGYTLFEVPSNLILARLGARRWIARIMITWGIIASGLMLVRTPLQFYALRFLLGMAEAGFFPGIIYYMSQWWPAEHRARATSRFMVAAPLAGAIGNPLGAWLLRLDGRYGVRGWQWLFLVEGIPAIALGIAVLWWLTERIEDARWLKADQRMWLTERMRRDHDDSPALHGVPPLRALLHPMIWLLTLPYFLISLASYGYYFWGPTIIRDTLHATTLVTGLIAGGIALLTAAAQLGFGFSSDRTGERSLHAAAGCAIAGVGYACVVLLPNPVARIAALAVAFMGSKAFSIPFWCMPGMVFRGAAAAATLASINAFGNIAGAVAPTMIGLFRDVTGSMVGAYVVLAAASFVAAACLVDLARRQPFAESRSEAVDLSTGSSRSGVQRGGDRRDASTRRHRVAGRNSESRTRE
jgi:MFS transporter, ACS family, tartrate transporter